MSQETNTRTVNIAQVGVGYWGKNLLRNFAGLPGVNVVAACDQQPDMLARVEDEYPDITRTGRFQDLLDNDMVEAIVVATETPQHFEMAAQQSLRQNGTAVEL